MMAKDKTSNKTSIYIPDKAMWLYEAFRKAAKARGDNLSDASVKAFELYIWEVLSGVHIMNDAKMAMKDGEFSSLLSSPDRFSHYPETEGSEIVVGLDPGSSVSGKYNEKFSKMFNAMQKGEFPVGEDYGKEEEK